MAAVPAVAIAGLAISAAGTAASIASQMGQGGGSAGAKSAAASIDQLNYLEQQQQKKKGKTYAQLLEEIDSMNNKLAVVYVPRLCEALRNENPTMLYEEIKEKVFTDCRRIGWGGSTGSTIYHNLPSWLIEDDPQHKKIVKAWETRNANRLKASADSADEFLKQTPEPPKKKELEYEPVEHDYGQFEPQGEKGVSVSTQFGRINDAANDLYKALTDKDELPQLS